MYSKQIKKMVEKCNLYALTRLMDLHYGMMNALPFYKTVEGGIDTKPHYDILEAVSIYHGNEDYAYIAKTKSFLFKLHDGELWEQRHNEEGLILLTPCNLDADLFTKGTRITIPSVKERIVKAIQNGRLVVDGLYRPYLSGDNLRLYGGKPSELLI